MPWSMSLPKALFQKLFSKCPPNLTALPKNCPHPNALCAKCPLPFTLCHLPSSKCPPLKGVIGRGQSAESKWQRAKWQRAIGRGHLTEGNFLEGKFLEGNF